MMVETVVKNKGKFEESLEWLWEEEECDHPENVNREVLKILDEAKKDFPNARNSKYKFPDFTTIETDYEKLWKDSHKWLRKWFGSS